MRYLLLSVLAGLLLVSGACQKGGNRNQSDATDRYEVTVDGAGFHPSHLTVTAGKPATIVVTRTTDQTCGKEIVIPALNVRKELPLNEPVEVTVTQAEKGQIQFACGMDMMKGIIDVQ